MSRLKKKTEKAEIGRYGIHTNIIRRVLSRKPREIQYSNIPADGKESQVPTKSQMYFLFIQVEVLSLETEKNPSGEATPETGGTGARSP